MRTGASRQRKMGQRGLFLRCDDGFRYAVGHATHQVDAPTNMNNTSEDNSSPIDIPAPRHITSKEVAIVFGIEPISARFLFSQGIIRSQQITGGESVADILDVYRYFESEAAGTERLLPVEVTLEQLTQFHRLCTVDRLRPSLVQTYAEAMTGGTQFPPAIVFRHGDGTFMVVDGRHRIHAAKLANKGSFRCLVRPGSIAHENVCALAANSDNGRKRSPAESEAAVGEVVKEFPGLSDRRIGKLVGLTHPTVRKILIKLGKRDSDTSRSTKKTAKRQPRQKSDPLAELNIRCASSLDTIEKIRVAVGQVLDKAAAAPKSAASALRLIARDIEALRPKGTEESK